MGKFFSKFINPREMRVLMLGLDYAGKTTILDCLSRKKIGSPMPNSSKNSSTLASPSNGGHEIEVSSPMTIPTVGFNVKSITYKNIKMNVWDVGGQDTIRKLWRHYFSGSNCLIFVIDANEPNRMKSVCTELNNIIKHQDTVDVPLLILANKQDLRDAMSPQTILDELKNNSVDLKTRPYCVLPCSARNNEGLLEALNWIVANVKTLETTQ